jgi:hypothetical protein
VMHTNPIANLMIKRYRHLLFPPTQLPKPRHIFKNLTQYHASLKESNIHFELES